MTYLVRKHSDKLTGRWQLQYRCKAWRQQTATSLKWTIGVLMFDLWFGYITSRLWAYTRRWLQSARALECSKASWLTCTDRHRLAQPVPGRPCLAAVGRSLPNLIDRYLLPCQRGWRTDARRLTLSPPIPLRLTLCHKLTGLTHHF